MLAAKLMRSRLRLLSFAFGALGLSIALTTGCSGASDDPAPFGAKVTVRGATYVSSPDLYDEVVVKEDRLEVPAGHPALAHIAPGTVLTGLASAKNPDRNPYGYWRRVTAVTREGAWVVLATERASLADAFEEASFDVVLTGRGAAGVLPATAGTLDPSTQALRPLAEDGELRATFAANFPPMQIAGAAELTVDGSSAGAERTLRLEGGYVKVEPYVRLAGEFQPSFSTPVKFFQSTIGMEFDSELSVSFASKISGSAPIVLKGKELTKPLVPSRVIGAGAFPIGPIPVPYTIRVRVDVGCTWSLAGTVKVTSTTNAKAQPYARLTYAPDQGWSYDDAPLTMDITREAKMDAEGELGAKCALEPRIGVYIADNAGPYLTPAPYLEATAKASTECPPPGASLSVDVGIDLKLGAELNVFGSGLGGSADFSLPFPLSTPLFQRGAKCGGAGVSEPCVGRADGYYCGADVNGDPGVLYSCNDNATTSKTPCPNACDGSSESPQCS